MHKNSQNALFIWFCYIFSSYAGKHGVFLLICLFLLITKVNLLSLSEFYLTKYIGLGLFNEIYSIKDSMPSYSEFKEPLNLDQVPLYINLIHGSVGKVKKIRNKKKNNGKAILIYTTVVYLILHKLYT